MIKLHLEKFHYDRLMQSFGCVGYVCSLAQLSVSLAGVSRR